VLLGLNNRAKTMIQTMPQNIQVMAGFAACQSRIFLCIAIINNGANRPVFPVGHFRDRPDRQRRRADGLCQPPPQQPGYLSLLQISAEVAALACLFTHMSRDWFAGRPAPQLPSGDL
jgi:hypothetical protein